MGREVIGAIENFLSDSLNPGHAAFISAVGLIALSGRVCRLIGSLDILLVGVQTV